MDAKRAVDKIQYPCRIKTLSKLGIEVNFLNSIMNIYRKITANVTHIATEMTTHTNTCSTCSHSGNAGN